MILNLQIQLLELISHLQEDRVFLGEKSKISEFIVATIECADQAERNFFIPGRRISYRWIGAPIAGRVVAHKDVGQNRIPQIAGADSEGEIGGEFVDFLRAGEWMDAVVVIKNDALKNLKGHSERTPRIVLQEGY